MNNHMTDRATKGYLNVAPVDGLVAWLVFTAVAGIFSAMVWLAI